MLKIKHVLFSIIYVLLSTSQVFSQCYQNINTTNSLPHNYSSILLENEEQQFVNFFELDVALLQINNADRFCYQIDSQKGTPRLVIGELAEEQLKNFELKESAIYSNLLAYYFLEEGISELDEMERNLPHLLAGYYFCYSNITKDWDTIKDDVKMLKHKSDLLNNFLDNYTSFFESYKSENVTNTTDSKNIKLALLKGSYYAMPPGYRMHVDSDKIIGNDITLLFKEATTNLPQDSNSNTQAKGFFLESDLVFIIKKQD